MIEVKFYDYIEDSLLRFAVIVAKYKGKWVFCKHKERDTYEVAGGHREENESILRHNCRIKRAKHYSIIGDVKVCDNCHVLKELFKGAESNSQKNYLPVLAFLKEMVRQGRIELFAGDCLLEEVEKQLSDEIHYTIQHYFKCKCCNQYFSVSACIRGIPTYKVVDNLNTINFDNALWGKCGTLYE
jgi:hypothetical protein